MEYDYSYSYDAGNLDPSSVIAIVSAMLIPFLLIGIAFYVYSSWALMNIAKKTNTPNPWLAWIPIANLYLMTQIAQVPWWSLLVIFLGVIPVIGYLGVIGVNLWWWWKIAERRNRPGWWSLLIMFVPVVNLIFIGMLAWSEAEKKSTPSTKKA